MTFGEKLKKARQGKGYTQKELADLIGAKHNSISNWENDQNKPDPDTIELLCGVLDLSANYLLGVNETEFITYEAREVAQAYLKADPKKQAIVRMTLDLPVIEIKDLFKQQRILNAANEIDGATQEDKEHDDAIMDDDNF